MKRLLRRIRGAIGTGLTWAAIWFSAGMILLVGSLLVTGSTHADVPYPVFFGVLGFGAGALFSGVLTFMEGHRRFDRVSAPRFAAWGATGGFAFATFLVGAVTIAEDPAFLSSVLFLGPLFAIAGAGSAAASLALARRATTGLLHETGQTEEEVGLFERDV